jgi:Reverse transcriptase (RNA-dependent DNA polymerase)
MHQHFLCVTTGVTINAPPSPDGQGDIDPRSHGHNLRTNRTQDYGHRFDHQSNAQQFLQHGENKNLVDSPGLVVPDVRSIFGDIFNQMSATVGIQNHRQAAVDALFKEFAQLDDKEVFEPVHSHTLTKSQKAAALRAINLIKEKRSGKLKGRACADGRPQRLLYTRDETASPTIATDALMITLMVDAAEHCNVATADVIGAYLHVFMPDYVLMKLVGDAVDIMCSVNPRYTEFVTIKHGKTVLYLRLVKALYGCVKSALLWYDLFTSKLKERGFVLNPYDPCVANSTIEGTQCTVCWYMDDTKISHVNPEVVSKVMKAIEESFGKMTVTQGNTHTFLGMDIEFNKNGTMTMVMNSYIVEAVARPLPQVEKAFLRLIPHQPHSQRKKPNVFTVLLPSCYIYRAGRDPISPPPLRSCAHLSLPLLSRIG